MNTSRRKYSDGDRSSPGTPAIAVFALALVVLLGATSPTSAQNKCDSGKLKCMRKKALCMLKVHERAIKGGEAPDAARLATCQANFDDPGAGCVAKLEAKQIAGKPATVCSVVGNAAALESIVDACVSNALAGLGNPVGPNTCDSKKLKCMRKKAVCLLKVHEKALKKGEVPDAARLSKCEAKFDDVATGCVAKVEAKQSPDRTESVCTTVGNTADLESIVDACVTDALGATSGGPTPTPTSSSNPTPTPDLCGNFVLDFGEECDGNDPFGAGAACPGFCQSDCTCSAGCDTTDGIFVTCAHGTLPFDYFGSLCTTPQDCQDILASGGSFCTVGTDCYNTFVSECLSLTCGPVNLGGDCHVVCQSTSACCH